MKIIKRIKEGVHSFWGCNKGIEKKNETLRKDCTLRGKILFGRKSNIVATIVLCIASLIIMAANIRSLNYDLAESSPSLFKAIKWSEVFLCEELIFHTGLPSKFDIKRWYRLGTRIGIFMLLIFFQFCFDDNSCILEYATTILSGFAFVVTICSNYGEYYSREKKQ